MFQSTPPEWGATDAFRNVAAEVSVSIHAPRVGSDWSPYYTPSAARGFNPRPPSGERPAGSGNPAVSSTFQSTPPEWGATLQGLTGWVVGDSFNPRPPSGERHHHCSMPLTTQGFQSTPPEWGATDDRHGGVEEFAVSIHAPRVGSDAVRRPRALVRKSFNPRPPSGERRGGRYDQNGNIMFQSTPPEWGATSFAVLPCIQLFSFNPRPPSGERL